MKDSSPSAESLQSARDAVKALLRRGYQTESECLEQAMEQLSDELGEAAAEALVPAMIEAERRSLSIEMESWPAVTDCERLDSAFAELEAGGIVARQDFTCCSTCGEAEIGDEMDAAAAAGTPIRGYTFFHAQDVDRAVEGGAMMLKYGPSPYDEGAVAGIGREIQQALSRHHLATEWDGSAAQCIILRVDWKRRPREPRSGA